MGESNFPDLGATKINKSSADVGYTNQWTLILSLRF